MVPSGQALHPPEFVRLAANPVRWRLLTELSGSDYRVRELVDRTEQPQNLVSYHLRLLRDAGLVTATRSSADGRDSYYHLDLDRCAETLASSGAALHPGLSREAAPPAPPVDQRRSRRVAVLFVCTGNTARSPVAEALLRHHAGGQVTVTSAGSHPGEELNPRAVRVLREGFGIDLADQRPRHLDALAGRRFDHVVTLCDKAREVCPEFGPDSRPVHWSIPDPAAAGGTGRAADAVLRRTAAEIDTRVRYLLPVLAAPGRNRS